MTPRLALGGLVAALALTAFSPVAHAKCDSDNNPQCQINSLICQVSIPRCYV
jgi:hypothetical protein